MIKSKEEFDEKVKLYGDWLETLTEDQLAYNPGRPMTDEEIAMELMADDIEDYDKLYYPIW